LREVHRAQPCATDACPAVHLSWCACVRRDRSCICLCQIEVVVVVVVVSRTVSVIITIVVVVVIVVVTTCASPIKPNRNRDEVVMVAGEERVWPRTRLWARSVCGGP